MRNDICRIAKDQRGAGIMEVMIAAGLLGFLVMILAQVFSDSAKQMEWVEFHANTNALVGEIQINMSNADLCTTALQLGGGLKLKNSANNNGQDIDLTLGNHVVKSNSKLPEYKMRVNRLYLSDSVRLLTIGNQETWSAKIMLEAGPLSGKGPTPRPKVAANVQLTVNANTNAITACASNGISGTPPGTMFKCERGSHPLRASTPQSSTVVSCEDIYGGKVKLGALKAIPIMVSNVCNGCGSLTENKVSDDSFKCRELDPSRTIHDNNVCGGFMTATCCMMVTN